MATDNQYIKSFQPLLTALIRDRERADRAGSLVEAYSEAILAARERIKEAQTLASRALKSRAGEVIYFRHVWPRVYGQLFYFQRAHGFLMERATVNPEEFAALIRREKIETRRFFRTHREFWLYYTSQAPMIDGQFTREYSRGCIYDPLCLVIDQLGATLASYRAAWGMAYGEYRKLLDRQQSKEIERGATPPDIEDYTWACSDADAVEWLYSLHAGNVILHKGEPTDVANLGRWFKLNFHKEIVNIYDRFKAVRNRKKDRAPFMRRLLGGLEKKMDQAEGKF